MKKTVHFQFLFVLIIPIMLFAACSSSDKVSDGDTGSGDTSAQVSWAGFRSSVYGVTDPDSTEQPQYPFPEPQTWDQALEEISSNYGNETIPTCTWIVGKVQDKDPRNGKILLEMNRPQDGGFEGVHFIDDSDADWSRGYTDHERWLSYFDQQGIKVVLQVEPGHSSVEELIDLVLGEWGHHTSVIGFGVDIEWYQNSSGEGGGAARVDNSTSLAWLEQVQSYIPGGYLMVKHWDPANLGGGLEGIPVSKRPYMIFCCDGQGIGGFDDFVGYMTGFASVYADGTDSCPVWYQIGYATDWWTAPSWAPANKPWFASMKEGWQGGKEGIPVDERDEIPAILGQALADSTSPDQKIGIIWVDFTMRVLYPEIF